MAKGYLYDNGDELITREDVNEVPDGSTASAGDVLSLDSNKKPKWSAPSGGVGGRIYATLSVDGSAISFANELGGEALTLGDVLDAVKNGASIFTKCGASDMRAITYQGTELVAGDLMFVATAVGVLQKLVMYFDVAFPASEGTSLDTSDLDPPSEWTEDNNS